MGRVTPLCGGTDKGVYPRSLPTPAPSQVSATDPFLARGTLLTAGSGRWECLPALWRGGWAQSPGVSQGFIALGVDGQPCTAVARGMQKAPWGKGGWSVLPGCDQLNLHEISTPVLSSQAAATWDPSLVSQLLYLLFHDTNLLLDPDRKLERTGCLKAKCYWRYMKWNEVKVARSCLTLGDPVDCSQSGSSMLGILQARIQEWVAIPFSRGSSWPRDRTWVSHFAGRYFFPAGREAICMYVHVYLLIFSC